MGNKSQTTTYLVIAAVVVLGLVLVGSMSSKPKTVNTTSLGTTGGILAGTGSLLSGLGSGLKSSGIFSGSGDSSGDYSPNIVRGEDTSIGG